MIKFEYLKHSLLVPAQVFRHYGIVYLHNLIYMNLVHISMNHTIFMCLSLKWSEI